MATIRNRNGTYQIRVSCGYDGRGKQLVQTLNWKPAPDITKNQIAKELQRQAVLFEEKCLHGQTSTAIKFADFTRQWFEEYADNLKPQTVRGYHYIEQRVFDELGHIRLDKLTTRHIQQYVAKLRDGKLRKGKKKSDKPLSPKTIKNHVLFISSVCSYAVEMKMIPENPCKFVRLPDLPETEKTMYSLSEVQELLDRLLQEDENNMKFAIFFILAIYSGFRRGELLGLEWSDFDFEYDIVTVNRTSAWTKERGTYTDTPKSKSSYRSIKLPHEVMELLLRFKECQSREREQIGSKWEEHDRLFTQWNGAPMSTNAPCAYFKRFCKRTGMRYVSRHSFRHFNASILINSGIDVKIVQTCLGHACANTTLNIYAKTFRTAQARAMQAISGVINLQPAQ